MSNDIRDEVSLTDVIRKACTREQVGKQEYGSESYHDLNLFDEIEEELLDQIVYSYLQILKIRLLKRKVGLLL